MRNYILVRDYDRLNRVRERWNSRIENGIADQVDLIDYILTIDECGYETIPMSVGMGWIADHPEEFKTLVGNVDEFIEHCLELVDQDPDNEGAGQLRWGFFKTFICCEKLMALLSPTWRELWIEELYPRFGANNHRWISAAILTGVSREKIALAILQELEMAQVREGCVNLIESFLEYGRGPLDEAPVHRALRSLGITDGEMDRLRSQIEKDPTNGFPEIEARLKRGIKPTEDRFFGGFPSFPSWYVLSNSELQKALKICARKAPGKTMSALEDRRIKQRLSHDQIHQVFDQANLSMTSLKGVSVEMLEKWLSLDGRKNLAGSLEPVEKHASYMHRPTAQFLFRIIVELPKAERETFWVDVVERVLEGVSPIDLYCVWRQLKLEEKDVEITLTRPLIEKGVCKGTVQRVPKPGGGTQFAVDMDGMRYVQSRDQHRYFPTEGEEVLFSRNGMRLTPYVIAVYFTPVMRDVKD